MASISLNVGSISTVAMPNAYAATSGERGSIFLHLDGTSLQLFGTPTEIENFSRLVFESADLLRVKLAERDMEKGEVLEVVAD